MKQLEALLRCPQCGSEVVVEEIACCAAGEHRYPVVQGIPVFIDAESVAGDPQYAGQRAYFDAEFSGYERYALENWRVGYLDRLRESDVLGGSAPLVDVGVGGSGYTVIEAARAGRPAIGCDLSLQGLLVAREFDRAALRELARVLEPGGRAWVTVPHDLQNISPVFRRANRRHDRRLGHLRRYEAEMLVDAGRNVGLEPVEIQFTGHAVKVLQLLARRVSDRLWWWCERKDRWRSNVRRGSMQLSVVFERAA